MTQIARHATVPLLDIGTLAQLRSGSITLHGAIERFTPGGAVFAGGAEVPLDAVVLGTGYRPGIADFLPGWQQVCDSTGAPAVSGGPTALHGLHFIGMYVSPAGMLREIGIEARRLGKLLAARQ